MNIVVILLCILIGAFLIVIRTLNMLLGKEIGIYGSNLVNHITGAIGSALLFGAALVMNLNGAADFGGMPWYAMTGGLLGCMFVVLSNYSFSRTSVINSTILILVGQFLCSLLIDLLVLKMQISMVNIIGAVLICCGVVLYNFEITKKKKAYADDEQADIC